MLLFLCSKVNRTQRSMYYLYYKRQVIHLNLRNELHIRGKQHLCKGCNEDDTASSDCSTFQGLPKANTRRKNNEMLYTLVLEWEIRKGKRHPKTSIYLPVQSHKQKLWRHLDKLRKSGSLNASCHPQQLPTIILQLKAKMLSSNSKVFAKKKQERSTLPMFILM